VSLEAVAKIVLGVGVGLLVLGGILYFLARLGLTDIPGSFVYRGKNLTVYVPIGLMILVSLLATLFLNIFFRR
jgi:hypothetical protein